MGSFFLLVSPQHTCVDCSPGSTVLHYEVNVTPRLLFPAAFVERIIRTDLPTNLRAMAARAEGCTTLSQGSTYVPSSPTVPLLLPLSLLKKTEDGNLEVHFAGGSTLVAPQQLSSDESTSSSVCVELKEKTSWSERDYMWGGVGKSCKLGKPCAVDEVHLRRFDDLLVSAVNFLLHIYSYVNSFSGV